jgi:hypothetical protein
VPAKANHNNLCGQKLTMPTMITGQNGAAVKQTTKIAVTGCHKAPRRHGRHRKQHHNTRR